MSSVLRPARKRKKVRKLEERVAHGRPEERVAVMDEEPYVSQESVLGIGGVPHELGDPRPVGLEPGRAVVLLRARGRAVARRRRADDDGRGRLRQGATGGGQDAVFQRVIMGRGEGGPRIEAHGPAARKEAMACVSALPIDRRRPYRRRRPGARIQPG